MLLTYFPNINWSDAIKLYCDELDMWTDEGSNLLRYGHLIYNFGWKETNLNWKQRKEVREWVERCLVPNMNKVRAIEIIGKSKGSGSQNSMNKYALKRAASVYSEILLITQESYDQHFGTIQYLTTLDVDGITGVKRSKTSMTDRSVMIALYKEK